MDSSKNAAWDKIQNFRVADLQAVLEFARLPRQGYKRDLLLRCQILVTSKWSPQLGQKIEQIHQAKMNSSRTFSWARQYSTNLSTSQTVLVPTTSSSDENLPLPNHVQFVHLPFFETIRNIESVNMPVNRKTFNPLHFHLTDFDVDLILKGVAKVFLRLAPTHVPQRQNDVIPCYLFVQCNGQTIISNNVGRVINVSAHSLMFPCDLTDQIIPKAQNVNSLNYCWIHLPLQMGLRNLPASYTLAIQLVRCISLDSLCTNILQRQMPMIKSEEKKSDVSDVEDLGLLTTRHRVSLLCPITQKLIVQPVKSRFCSHMACFDLRAFLQLNQRRSQWICPFCKKSAAYETLHFDQSFKKILDNAPSNCTTVEIDSSSNNILDDCHYILDNLKEDKSDPQSSQSPKPSDDYVELSSGSEDEQDDEEEEERSSSSQVSSNPSTPTVNDVAALPCSIASERPEEALWENIALFNYNFIVNQEAQDRRRKRTRSSHSPVSKRSKVSSSTDIEVITLSSSDSSDNENDPHS